jgi:exosortase/archaeosortase family protein
MVFMKNNLFNQVRDYFKKKEKEIVSSPKKQFSSFLILFVFFYLLFTGITIPFEDSAKIFTGKSIEGFLGLQGIKTSEIGLNEKNGETAYSFFIENLKEPINIINLCTGILEIIILISAILASIGISFRDKLVGISISIFAGIIFNLIRIWITINIILLGNIGFAEFVHGFLFKLILFLYIIGFYVTWFYWTQNKEYLFQTKEQFSKKSKKN